MVGQYGEDVFGGEERKKGEQTKEKKAIKAKRVAASIRNNTHKRSSFWISTR